MLKRLKQFLNRAWLVGYQALLFKALEKRDEKFRNLVSYPLMIYFEFNAEQDLEEKGRQGVMDGAMKTITDTIDAVKHMINDNTDPVDYGPLDQTQLKPGDPVVFQEDFDGLRWIKGEFVAPGWMKDKNGVLISGVEDMYKPGTENTFIIGPF